MSIFIRSEKVYEQGPRIFSRGPRIFTRPEHFHTDRTTSLVIVQELCESRGGRSELSVLTSLLVSVDVKNY